MLKEQKIKELHFANVQYGFEYGSAKITRLFSNKKKGWVTIGVNTPKHSVQVYITRTGKVRVHDQNGEWFPNNKK